MNTKIGKREARSGKRKSEGENRHGGKVRIGKGEARSENWKLEIALLGHQGRARIQNRESGSENWKLEIALLGHHTQGRMTYPARVLPRHLYVLEHQIREYTVLWLRIVYGVIRITRKSGKGPRMREQSKAVFSAPAINGAAWVRGYSRFQFLSNIAYSVSAA